MSGPLSYWTPAGATPARVLPPAEASRSAADRTDLLTMAVVVCVAAAMAFAIVIGMAWALGA